MMHEQAQKELMQRLSEDQLVEELWAYDVPFLMGGSVSRAPMLSPTRLIAALAESRESRLQLSLIPLFMRHPEFANDVSAVMQSINSTAQLMLKCFYTAAVWLERKYLLQSKLPDLFSEDLGFTPTTDAQGNLEILAKQQKQLCNPGINWIGTYEHAAIVWLKEVDLQRHKNE